MSTSIKPTIAVFGATGDCAGYCLATALKAGHSCTALARTPSKLTDSLKSKGVSTEALKNLTITQGNVKDKSTVKDALVFNNKPVDIIVSGIGSLPKYQWSVVKPVTLQDPTICAVATTTILDALSEIHSESKPLVIVVSTTGIGPPGAPRDVPLALVPLYHWFLSEPHRDKLAMEDKLRTAISLPVNQRPIESFVAVKPSLLMNGNPTGIEKVRAGSEGKPSIGYSITRVEVGQWIYEKLIAEKVKGEWLGKGVSITT